MGLSGITAVVGCITRQDWCSIQYRGVGPVCVVTVQVALMSEVARARAAVDAHVRVAGVVEAWLGFLRNLSLEKANRVRCRCRVWDGCFDLGYLVLQL